MAVSVYRSLIALLILGIVNLALPASALASAPDDETARIQVTSKAALLAPGILQRSIAIEAHRAALQAQTPKTGTGSDKHSHMACTAGYALMGGATAAFVTAFVKHRNWANSGATTTPGAKPPSSVGWSVAAGSVLAGASLFTLAKGCGN